MIEVQNSSKSHRTALVVDGDLFDSNGTYAERVNRLLQSLNGPNIKVDVFARRGNTVVRTSTTDVSAPDGPGPLSLDEIASAVKAEGYDQILTSVG